MTPVETGRQLPPVSDMLEQQQRGWACVWCRAWFPVGLSTDLGQQRVVPATGAAYLWFPRECLDTAACAKRAAM
ncbi:MULTISPECIES: hypothetical protein [unclassified Streptomyces]|uniref:hypothetical protein n=1 Tax=unclassified Streptomyces TaxID=2593676 RepID=UPI000BF0A662|nr:MULTISPECIES: hypothetical protein [unclassified Streptomyces]